VIVAVRSSGAAETHSAPAGLLVRRIVTVAVLVALTWALGGYQFAIWPQLFPLELIRALAGELRGDWYTAHPAPHWVFDHAMALVSDPARPAVFAILWVVGLAAFWWAFVSLADGFGATESATLAVGWAGAWSGFAGFGTVTLLAPFTYPSALACAASAWALREAFRGRARLAGLALGIGLLLHPQVGVLTVLITGAVLLRTTRPRAWIESAGITLVVGGFALFHLVRDLGTREPISSAERFALLSEVRLPHHLLYARFPAWEYVMVASWLAVLIVAAWRLRSGASVVGWGAAVGAVAATCAAGALASLRGSPLALVEMQTARLSTWVPFLALAAAGAALSESLGPWGAALAFPVVPLAFALGGPWRSLCARIGLDGMPTHALAAPLLLAALGASRALARRDAPAPGREKAPVGQLLLFAVLAGAALRAGGWRHPPRTVLEPAWVDIAQRAGDVSAPTDLFLTPPELDGFRYFSRRPIVVDFGDVAHDDLRAWRDRLVAVTRDSLALAPRPVLSAAERSRRLAADYDATVWLDRAVVDRFHVRFVVVRAGGPPPPDWALPIADNGRYAIYRVRAPALPARPTGKRAGPSIAIPGARPTGSG